MGDNLPLDSFLHEYHGGKLRKKELEGIIFEYLLKNSNRFKLHGWPRDECVDFLCWFYPRIGRAIDKYRDTGFSFDAYIAAMVQWASKEYIRIEASHRITEQTYWNMYTRELEVCEHEPAYDSGAVPFKPVSNPRQALMLLLKSYYFISEDFIDRAAPAMGMKRETLKGLVEQMRNMRAHRDELIKGRQERIHTLHYRCLSFERRMNTALEGSARYEKLKIRLERARKQLASMRKRFSRMRIEPTNLQVAQVLGIPKGTIDSGLFAIKMKSGYRSGDAKNSGDDPAGQTVDK
jgi:hypothetical protein